MDIIYLIRHAEKPPNASEDDDAIVAADMGVPAGVDADGVVDRHSLTPQGWTRAGTWAVYFRSSANVQLPNQIYASVDKRKPGQAGVKLGSHSKRPMQTVTPLAQRLGYTLNTDFFKGEEAGLAGRLKTLSGVTLVCWQHEAIPAIAKALVAETTPIPGPWPGDRFDAIWRFTRAAAGPIWIFDQILPQLLAGDPATEI